MKKSTENWILGIFATAFLFYILVRSYLLPLTHDEGATVINHVPRLVADSLMYEREASLNNHILSTLAIKVLLGIFPGHQFVVRIPAMIGGFLYLGSVFALCRRLSTQVWVRLFGVAVLLGNPFMLEFFSLARGYGLAIGLMTMALYQAWRFFENNAARTLRNAFIFAGLAVYANFTLLLFFIPFSGLLFWSVAQQNRGWSAFWSVVRPAFYTFGIFILLWITPVVRLSKGEEIHGWSQLPSNMETIRLLMYSSVHGHAYLGLKTDIILAWAAWAFMLTGWVITARKWWQNRMRFASEPSVFFAAIFLGAVAINLVQTTLLHTANLNARVSLFFYPLFSFLLITVADWLWTHWGRRSWIFMSPVLLLVLINNVRSLNLRQTFEWWFDSYTFQVLDKMRAIKQAEGRTEPYSFDASWLVINSYMIHINEFSGYEGVAQHMEWHPDRTPVPGAEFFFVLRDDEVAVLADQYNVIHKFPRGTLLRKK